MGGGLTSAIVAGTAILLGAARLVSATLRRRHTQSAVEPRRGVNMPRGAATALAKTGHDLLHAVVWEIASSLGADLVFIGELVGDQVQTVAVNRHGEAAENFAFGLKDSPSLQLTNRRGFCHTDRVLDLFANDPHLAAINARGCVGVALIGTRHEPIGVIMAATAQPLARPAHATSLLALFVARVAAELERAQTERELRKSEEHLRQVQRVDAIGRLAGGIAHDFNNLLMIMIGYAEILRDRDGASPEVTELLAAANRATTLTRQLLAFGRRQVLQAQRLNVNRVVTQVQTMLAPVLGAQIQLTTSLDPTLPNVEADPGQIEQVLVNLALNARDAMPQGGTLRLDTRTEHVQHAYYQMPPGTYVCLSVSDTGIGMSPDVQAHIFEPFYTTKGSCGTGLGLSSVYGIVKQSGGFIWCTSEPGRGSTFTIYLLPASGGAATVSAPETAPEIAESGAGGTELVLVVDDDPGVRRLLTRLLRARGYTVYEADGGAAALALMAATVPQVDLVVTDIVMPGMSGTRLAEEIERRWPAVRLLFVTGYAQSATLGSSDIMSRVPVLGKPFALARMAAAVREMLDGAPPSAQSHATR